MVTDCEAPCTRAINSNPMIVWQYKGWYRMAYGQGSFFTVGCTQYPHKRENESVSTLSDLVGFDYVIFLTPRCELHLQWHSKMAYLVIIVCWSIFRFNQKYVGNRMWFFVLCFLCCRQNYRLSGKTNGNCLIQISHRDLNFVYHQKRGNTFVTVFKIWHTKTSLLLWIVMCICYKCL